jgi:methylenetetrahydrofolate reductase (NADPH)
MILQPDVKITELLENFHFTLSAEIMPPRNGANPAVIMDEIRRLTGAGADFLAVTKGAGGSLRGGSLPIAQIIKEGFATPAIAHFTCRDLLPEEVENQLMDHHYFGIRNILALRGDPPQGTTEWLAREGSYDYAYQLVEQIRSLNSGQYLNRSNDAKRAGAASGSEGARDEREKTDFCIGVAAYPDHPIESERIEFYRRKIEAGADFAITQMLFDVDSYARFLDDSAKAGLMKPVLPGTRLLRSQPQALRMANRFGVKISDRLLKQLPASESEASDQRTIEVFMRFTDELRTKGAPGIHIFVLTDLALAEAVLRALAG